MNLVLRLTGALALLISTLLATPTTASTESELNARWRGAWTVVQVETASGCQGSYTNNEVRGRRVQAKGAHRFSPGELATVYKINLKRKQVEVLVDLVEPVLVPHREGPFTLYDSLACKVELQIALPRGASSNSTAGLDELIGSILERHEGAESAEGSPTWNRRLREPFPEDYDETLAEYELWHAEQLNVEIAARIDEAVEEAARIVDRFDDDPDYLEGFARGVDEARDRNLNRDCERLLSMSASSFTKSASGDSDKAFREGFREGQKLVFFLETARRLPRCFVPPPG